MPPLAVWWSWAHCPAMQGRVHRDLARCRGSRLIACPSARSCYHATSECTFHPVDALRGQKHPRIIPNPEPEHKQGERHGVWHLNDPADPRIPRYRTPKESTPTLPHVMRVRAPSLMVSEGRSEIVTVVVPHRCPCLEADLDAMTPGLLAERDVFTGRQILPEQARPLKHPGFDAQIARGKVQKPDPPARSPGGRREPRCIPIGSADRRAVQTPHRPPNDARPRVRRMGSRVASQGGRFNHAVCVVEHDQRVPLGQGGPERRIPGTRWPEPIPETN